LKKYLKKDKKNNKNKKTFKKYAKNKKNIWIVLFFFVFLYQEKMIK
jgi:sugar phosphate permease